MKSPTELNLSRATRYSLYQRATKMGVSEAELATKLLEVIAIDDLCEAVLDVEVMGGPTIGVA